MNTRQELEYLVDFLKRQAEIAKNYTPTSDYICGLKDGYAAAYETCAESLNDILKRS